MDSTAVRRKEYVLRRPQIQIITAEYPREEDTNSECFRDRDEDQKSATEQKRETNPKDPFSRKTLGFTLLGYRAVST